MSEHWHPGPVRPLMTPGELRDELWAIQCTAGRTALPYPPRPANQPDSLLALNAFTAVRELVDDWEVASERLGYPASAASDPP